MKNLILIRHSKSSWDAPVQDIERSISQRGVKDAHLIAAKTPEILPPSYIVWSSKAKRTRETAFIFSQYLSIPLETIHFSEDLYTFDAKSLEKSIKKCENKSKIGIDIIISAGELIKIAGYSSKIEVGNITFALAKVMAMKAGSKLIGASSRKIGINHSIQFL